MTIKQIRKAGYENNQHKENAMKAKMQKPSIKQLAKKLIAIKREMAIEWKNNPEDYRDEADCEPSIQVTLACDETGFALQDGDNSFSGPAYFYWHWGVADLFPGCNCLEIAKDLIDQCQLLFDSSSENI
jgi:hypothetical protein